MRIRMRMILEIPIPMTSYTEKICQKAFRNVPLLHSTSWQLYSPAWSPRRSAYPPERQCSIGSTQSVLNSQNGFSVASQTEIVLVHGSHFSPEAWRTQTSC